MMGGVVQVSGPFFNGLKDLKGHPGPVTSQSIQWLSEKLKAGSLFRGSTSEKFNSSPLKSCIPKFPKKVVIPTIIFQGLC